MYPLLQKLNRSAVICSQVQIGYSCVGVSMTLTVVGSICVICESLLKKFICVSMQKLLMCGTVSVLPFVYIWSHLL